MKNTEKAFLWITDLLEKKKIDYKITGGLAARLYGATRELADIDIEIADAAIFLLADDAKPYITFGPGRYKDDEWDLVLMTLLYEGQEIDLAGEDGLFFNKRTQQWEYYKNIGLHETTTLEAYGKIVPVESKESLIAYKSKLMREVDQEDVRQLTR